jgi:hypothetical protein
MRKSDQYFQVGITRHAPRETQVQTSGADIFKGAINIKILTIGIHTPGPGRKPNFDARLASPFPGDFSRSGRTFVPAEVDFFT